MLARLAAAEEALKNIHDSPRGSLKITASHGIGAYWLLPRLKEFLKEYPEVEVHLVMDDRELDLSQRDADLAIRMRAPVQADLIQRKLFTVHYHMYASKAYLAQHPAPTTLEDICNHTIIVYGETAAPEIRDINWLLELYQKNFQPGCSGSVIRINNITGILQAVEAGLGIGVVPDYRGGPASGSGAGAAGRAGAGLRRASGLCRCAAPVQAGGGVPRFSGEGRQGLAVLSFRRFPGGLKPVRPIPISLLSRFLPPGATYRALSPLSANLDAEPSISAASALCFCPENRLSFCLPQPRLRRDLRPADSAESFLKGMFDMPGHGLAVEQGLGGPVGLKPARISASLSGAVARSSASRS